MKRLIAALFLITPVSTSYAADSEKVGLATVVFMRSSMVGGNTHITRKAIIVIEEVSLSSFISHPAEVKSMNFMIGTS